MAASACLAPAETAEPLLWLALAPLRSASTDVPDEALALPDAAGLSAYAVAVRTTAAHNNNLDGLNIRTPVSFTVFIGYTFRGRYFFPTLVPIVLPGQGFGLGIERLAINSRLYSGAY
jgi:hypothetical protein